MLCHFSFENYKAFKSEAILDFAAESISEYRESLITDFIDNEKYLPVAAIYGPNGGGKSTVLEALNFLRVFILQKIIVTTMRETDEKYDSVVRRFSSEVYKDKYHKFSPECANLPTRFEIKFRTAGRQFLYQISVLHNVVKEENFYVQVIGEKNVSLVFERTDEECVLGQEIEDIAVEKVNDTMPLLSHIAINYDIESVDKAIDWFLSMEVINYDDPRKEWRILLPTEEKVRIRMFQMLQDMDIQISDVRVEKDIDGNIENIFSRHLTEKGEYYEIPFKEESSGTRKLFSFLATILDCLETGKVMVADELDAKLHPKLLKYIIELFTNPESNRAGAQLLFTSHDITTMSSKVFRRDEIWLCARNPVGASKLYSLVSFRKENGLTPRNDEAYGKRYLEGTYGADPYIRKALTWEDEK